jgi:hypothetical protein
MSDVTMREPWQRQCEVSTSDPLCGTWECARPFGHDGVHVSEWRCGQRALWNDEPMVARFNLPE